MARIIEDISLLRYDDLTKIKYKIQHMAANGYELSGGIILMKVSTSGSTWYEYTATMVKYKD